MASPRLQPSCAFIFKCRARPHSSARACWVGGLQNNSGVHVLTTTLCESTHLFSSDGSFPAAHERGVRERRTRRRARARWRSSAAGCATCEWTRASRRSSLSLAMCLSGRCGPSQVCCLLYGGFQPAGCGLSHPRSRSASSLYLPYHGTRVTCMRCSRACALPHARVKKQSYGDNTPSICKQSTSCTRAVEEHELIRVWLSVLLDIAVGLGIGRLRSGHASAQEGHTPFHAWLSVLLGIASGPREPVLGVNVGCAQEHMPFRVRLSVLLGIA